MLTLKKLETMTLIGLMLTGTAALAAQDTMRRPENLPPAESTNEPLPSPPSPISSHDVTVRRQAGIGSTTSYARAGVLELGGGLTFSQSSQQTFLAVTPTIGWFLTDNIELSAIVMGAHSRVSGKRNASFVTGLIEPSVHIPFMDSLFGFAGLGVGATYDASRKTTGVALAPRLGLNIPVGRSGIFTPSATMNWSSSQSVPTPQGNMVAVNSTWAANIGYTVMW